MYKPHKCLLHLINGKTIAEVIKQNSLKQKVISAQTGLKPVSLASKVDVPQVRRPYNTCHLNRW